METFAYLGAFLSLWLSVASPATTDAPRASGYDGGMPTSAAILAVPAGWLSLASPATSDAPRTPEGDGGMPTFAALLAEPAGWDDRRRGQHPRLFFDAAALARLRERARRHPEAWRQFVTQSRALREEPPAPPAQGRGQHYAVGLALPEAAFAYAITREPQHLARAQRWIDAVLAYEPWGYAYSKPNQDIPAAFLLYGLSFAYDVIASDLPPDRRVAIQRKIAEKAASLYAAYQPKPGRTYTFSQNHTFINAAAIGFAGLVLHGEHPQAERWFVFSRAVFDRTIRTYSPDGAYYEGYHYFEFSVPWIVHYLDALEENTAARWYPRLRLDLAKHYVAHSLLPGGHVFDFGDSGTGATGRLAGTRELLGAQALLHRVAARYDDRASARVADWAAAIAGVPDREPLWTFIWRDPAAPQAAHHQAGAPLGRVPGTSTADGSDERAMSAPSSPADDRTPGIPLVHHFANAGLVFGRTSWDDDAIAFAFRCGPPEGHHVRALKPQLPEWRQNTGHAHPDAGSFILYARGRYLTGDAGYTGVKMTADHNAILIDGRGQAHDGRHEVFKDLPLDTLDAIRIVHVERAADQPKAVRHSAADQRSAARLTVEADGTHAYAPDLGLTRWRRTFAFDGDATFTVTDRVELARPRRVTWLLHADRDLTQAAPDTFVIGAAGSPRLVARVTASAPLTAAIAPHTVIAQGRPGSIERGETDIRGLRLTLDTAPLTQLDLQVVFRLDDTRRTSTKESRERSR